MTYSFSLMAVTAALASYFKQQGMNEAEITAVINDCKEKKAKNQPDVSAIEQQRDDASKRVAEMENMEYLRSKGVKQEDLDYVPFKAGKNVTDKTDFKKAADAFLKENPRYTGRVIRLCSQVRLTADLVQARTQMILSTVPSGRRSEGADFQKGDFKAMIKNKGLFKDLKGKYRFKQL